MGIYNISEALHCTLSVSLSTNLKIMPFPLSRELDWKCFKKSYTIYQRSRDPFYSNLLYEMGHYLLDTQYAEKNFQLVFYERDKLIYPLTIPRQNRSYWILDTGRVRFFQFEQSEKILKKAPSCLRLTHIYWLPAATFSVWFNIFQIKLRN